MERASNGRVGVELDAHVESWLDDAFGAAARRVELDLWFAAPTDTTDAPIIASIGEQRVGLVDPDATHALKAILATAALRAELPWTVGHLNRRKTEPRYVLDFPQPTDRDTPGT
jgi:hypothetical protein